MRGVISFAVKAVISATLIYIAIDWTQVGSTAQRLAEIKLTWAAMAIVSLLAQIPLNAWRWRAISLQCGAALPVQAAVQFTFIGAFFNQVLLPTVGSDAARIWLLNRIGAGWRAAMYSVLTDRGIGLLVLAGLVAVCLPWSFHVINNPVGRATLLLIAAGTIAGAAAFFALPYALGQWADRWQSTRHLVGVASVAWNVLAHVHPGALIIATSIAIHLLTVAAAWLVAYSVSAPLDFGNALLLIPPVILIASIPISIAGWGVRESAMMVAFGYAGLGQTEGVLVSILFGAALLVVGLIGGVVWISTPARYAMKMHASDAPQP